MPNTPPPTQIAESPRSTTIYKPVPTDFTLFHVIGQGAYAKVYFSQNKINEIFYAMKLVDKEHVWRVGKTESVTTERNALTTLKGHPGVVNLSFTLQDTHSLFFALEFCNGGELSYQIKQGKPLAIDVVRFYAAELAETIHFMHSRKVIHRDLKPSNILLTSAGHLKVCDFGTAKLLTGTEEHIPAALLTTNSPLDIKRQRAAQPHDESATVEEEEEIDFDALLDQRAAMSPGAPGLVPLRKESFVGTALYCYPEMLSSYYLTYGADWWSFGVILYEMLTGITPFDAESEYLTFQKIQTTQHLTFPPDIDPHGKDLVERLLHWDVRQRLGTKYEHERDIFQHPFFKPVWTRCRIESVKRKLAENGTQIPSPHCSPDSPGPGLVASNTFDDFSLLSSESVLQNSDLTILTPQSSPSHHIPITPTSLATAPSTPINDLSPSDYKRLLRTTKPLSIFSITPPAYIKDDELESANNRIIHNFTQQKQKTPLDISMLAVTTQNPTSPTGNIPSSPTTNNNNNNNNNNNKINNSNNNNNNNNNNNHNDDDYTDYTDDDDGVDYISEDDDRNNDGINNYNATLKEDDLFSPTPNLNSLGISLVSDFSPNNTTFPNLLDNPLSDSVVNNTNLDSQTPRILSQKEPRQSISVTPGLVTPDLVPQSSAGNMMPRSSSSIQASHRNSSILSAVVGQTFRVYFERLQPDPQFDQDKWTQYMHPSESVIAVGLIVKNNRWSSTFFLKKRQFVLTSHARLIYIDDQKKVVKGEIDIIGDGFKLVIVDAKNFELTSAEGRCYKIQCQTPPSMANWFVMPHRNAPPSTDPLKDTIDLPSGEGLTKSPSISVNGNLLTHKYVYNAEPRWSDQWKYCIETALSYNRHGGVVKQCLQLYRRQQHVDEQFGNDISMSLDQGGLLSPNSPGFTSSPSPAAPGGYRGSVRTDIDRNSRGPRPAPSRPIAGGARDSTNSTRTSRNSIRSGNNSSKPRHRPE